MLCAAASCPGLPRKRDLDLWLIYIQLTRTSDKPTLKKSRSIPLAEHTAANSAFVLPASSYWVPSQGMQSLHLIIKNRRSVYRICDENHGGEEGERSIFWSTGNSLLHFTAHYFLSIVSIYIHITEHNNADTEVRDPELKSCETKNTRLVIRFRWFDYVCVFTICSHAFVRHDVLSSLTKVPVWRRSVRLYSRAACVRDKQDFSVNPVKYTLRQNISLQKSLVQRRA